MPNRQVVVRLSGELLAELDKLVANGTYESRADAVRAGVGLIAAIEQRRRVDRAVVDGYRRVPTTPAEVDAAVASLREAIAAEEPW